MAKVFRHKTIRNHPAGIIVNDQPFRIDRKGFFTVDDPAMAQHLWASLGPTGTNEIEAAPLSAAESPAEEAVVTEQPSRRARAEDS